MYIEPHIINYVLAVADKIIATAISLIVLPLIIALRWGLTNNNEFH